MSKYPLLERFLLLKMWDVIYSPEVVGVMGSNLFMTLPFDISLALIKLRDIPWEKDLKTFKLTLPIVGSRFVMGMPARGVFRTCWEYKGNGNFQINWAYFDINGHGRIYLNLKLEDRILSYAEMEAQLREIQAFVDPYISSKFGFYAKSKVQRMKGTFEKYREMEDKIGDVMKRMNTEDNGLIAARIWERPQQKMLELQARQALQRLENKELGFQRIEDSKVGINPEMLEWSGVDNQIRMWNNQVERAQKFVAKHPDLVERVKLQMEEERKAEIRRKTEELERKDQANVKAR